MAVDNDFLENNTMEFRSNSIAPLSARRQLMEEPNLGAGSFLDYGLKFNPNKDEPFVLGEFT